MSPKKSRWMPGCSPRPKQHAPAPATASLLPRSPRPSTLLFLFFPSHLGWKPQKEPPSPAPASPPLPSGRSVLLLRHLRLWLSESWRMTAQNQMLHTDELQGHYAEAAVPYKRRGFTRCHDFPCGIVWFQHLGVTISASHIFCWALSLW